MHNYWILGVDDDLIGLLGFFVGSWCLFDFGVFVVSLLTFQDWFGVTVHLSGVHFIFLFVCSSLFGVFRFFFCFHF